jgi:GH15 family glucan-1,4-alpha-glucosidase
MKFPLRKLLIISTALAMPVYGLMTGVTMANAATTTTNPSTTSADSLYMSNWSNLMGIWMNSQLNQNDNSSYGPRLGELHYSNDWATNQIVDYSGFFRDETNSVKYDQIHNFSASGFLDSGGILESKYLTYNGASLPVSISRDYATVPNQNFIVVRYTLTNTTSSPITWNTLDQVHFNNNNASSTQHAWYDGTRQALFNDMSASGQYYMALGSLQTPTSYQVGNDGDSNTSDATVGSWYAFDATGTLPDNTDVTGSNLDAGFENKVTIPAQGSTQLYYYLAIDSSLSAVQSDVDSARAQTGSYWFNTTQTDWTNWLNSGKRISTSDSGVNTAYDRNLIVIKDSQNPTTGSFPAATNPSSYSYKVWARDSAFTAMALDASGHYAEAEKYWNWLSSVQNSDGTFSTCYSLWTSAPISFVQPEYDSLGTFLLGVWRHIQLTGETSSSTFVQNIWPSVQKSANFIMNNIDATTGLGASDHSIWEQDQEFYTFTQAMNVVGLYAAENIGQMEGATSSVDSWNGAAGTILSNVQKSDTSSVPGLWNAAGGYYDQAVTTSDTANTTVDSSTNALIGWGAIDAASSRANSHVQTVVNTLTHDTWGIARYPGDTYYYTSPYSPAGNESGSTEPVWPQMTNYVALDEIYTGDLTDAFSRLQYYALRSGVGYMPPGEAVSWYYQRPIVSTMSEPLTAASFIMTSLAYTGQYDGRVLPPQYNAGSYKTINVTTSPSSDWSQWANVPYFVQRYKDTSPSNTHIANVAISNDANNIYIRIDNTSGALPAYNTSPLFGVIVYGEDYNHNSSTSSLATGMYGGALTRSMSYAVGRWSNSSNFSHFNVSGGTWAFDYNITNVIAPQWDPATGRIEMVIPISDLSSSGAVATDSWANLDVTLVSQNASGQWQRDDLGAIHYRITSSSDQWIYGNVR